jgi:hypothetical protein
MMDEYFRREELDQAARIAAEESNPFGGFSFVAPSSLLECDGLMLEE